MYIRVHVQPGAKREKVTKISETELQLAVREPAERNMANKRVRELVAFQYNTVVTKVRILTGHRSSTKIVDVEV